MEIKEIEQGVINKAREMLQPINFEPHYTVYFVTQDSEDMGNSDYCINCITNEVKEARKYHKEERKRILDKFKEIETTGFFEGINIKAKYSDDEIKKAKRYKLEEYPSRVKFDYEGHDPDFGGGATEPGTCADCGEYFDTNFEPNLEECGYLLEEYGNDKNISESLKWKLDIVFYNWKYLENDAKKVFLSIAEKIKQTKLKI